MCAPRFVLFRFCAALIGQSALEFHHYVRAEQKVAWSEFDERELAYSTGIILRPQGKDVGRVGV